MILIATLALPLRAMKGCMVVMVLNSIMWRVSLVMQFGFTGGRGTVDAIFVIRQVQEKFIEKKKDLWMAFVDLEKAFDRVPRAVLWWALRKLGVEEWLINVIKAMYEGATTAV